MIDRQVLAKIMAGKLESFNLWRNHYEEMTFRELVGAYNAWALLYPLRQDRNFCLPTVLKAIEEVKEQLNKETLNIVELGGYEGALAYDVLTCYPDFTYVNYDLCSIAIQRTKNQLKKYKFDAIRLKKPFWDTPITRRHYGETLMSTTNLKQKPPNFDLFITSHTLEHLINKEVFKVLDHIAEVPFMYIQMPIREGGYDGVTAGHICSLSWLQIQEHLSDLGYKEVKIEYLERWEKRMCDRHQNYVEIIRLLKHG